MFLWKFSDDTEQNNDILKKHLKCNKVLVSCKDGMKKIISKYTKYIKKPVTEKNLFSKRSFSLQNNRLFVKLNKLTTHKSDIDASRTRNFAVAQKQPVQFVRADF